MTFTIWTGIMLGCATLILTAVAIVIAIVTFLGYRKIVKSSGEIATNTAKDISERIAAETIKSEITMQLAGLFNRGELDSVVQRAVETVSYRGMSSLPDLDDSDLIGK
jgi:hypothetical protein